MRARTVNEDINFERGRDPKAALGLGFHEMIEKQVDKIIDLDHQKPGGWSCTYEVNYDRNEGALVISTYPGYNCSTYLKGLLNQLGIGQYFKSWYSYPDEYGFQLKSKYQGVNEAQNFERGKDPKESMGIGGIDLAEEFETRLDELKMQIGGLKVTEDEDWYNYLVKVLVGKRITAEMTLMPTMDTKTKVMSGKREKGKYTIKVADIKPTDNLSDILDSPITRSYPEIIVADTDKNIYTMKMDQKIRYS